MGVFLLTVLGCGGTAAPANDPEAPTTPASAPATQPFDLDAALAREATGPLVRQDVAVGSPAFRGVLASVGAPTYERKQGATEVTAGIGAEASLLCTVYDEEIDLANSLRRVFEAVKANFPRVEIQWITPGFEGATAFLDLAFYYLVDSAEGPKVGMVKLRAANAVEHGILCTHDEVGFVRTFDQATRPLLAAPPRTVRLERYFLLLDERPIGVSTREVITDGDGGRSLDMSSLIAPLGTAGIAGSDERIVARWETAGDLVESLRVVSNNEDLSRYELARVRGRNYQSKGTHRGRPFEGTFVATDTLRSPEVSVQVAARALLGRGRPRPVRHLVYSGTLNQLAPTEVTYSVQGAADEGRSWISMAMGDHGVRALVRPSGDLDELEMQGEGPIVRLRRAAD